MQCPKCDNQNLPEAKFCAQCGQVLPDPERPEAPTHQGSRSWKKQNPVIGFAVGSVVGFIVGGIIGAAIGAILGGAFSVFIVPHIKIHGKSASDLSGEQAISLYSKADWGLSASIGGILGTTPGILMLIAAFLLNDSNNEDYGSIILGVLGVITIIVSGPGGAIAGVFVTRRLRSLIKRPIPARIVGGIVGGILGLCMTFIFVLLLISGRIF